MLDTDGSLLSQKSGGRGIVPSNGSPFRPMPSERRIDDNHVLIVAAAGEAVAGIERVYSFDVLDPVLAMAGHIVMMASGLAMSTHPVIMVGSASRVEVQAASEGPGMTRGVFVAVEMGTRDSLQQELDGKQHGGKQPKRHPGRLPAALPQRQSRKKWTLRPSAAMADQTGTALRIGDRATAKLQRLAGDRPKRASPPGIRP